MRLSLGRRRTRAVRFLPGRIPNLIRLLFLATVLLVPAIFFFLSSGLANSSETVIDFENLRPIYPNTDSALFDLKNFRYDLTTDICERKNETLFLLLLVHSAPAHFTNRREIRKIWSHAVLDLGPNFAVRTVFLLGRVRDRNLQDELITESRLHGDILQGSFYDSYKNLTYKHVMGLKWAGTRCLHAHFLVKMDDDIFVDIHRLASALDIKYPMLYGDPVDRSRGRMACYIQRKMPVTRDQLSKWYISKKEYQSDYFRDYCSGWAYALTPSVANRLVHSSLYFPYFWVDDVHVTGTVANHAGIERDAMNDCCYSITATDLSEWSKSPGKYSWRYMIGPTWGDVELLNAAHRKAVWCHRERCQCCFKADQMGIIRDSSHGSALHLAGVAKKIAIN